MRRMEKTRAIDSLSPIVRSPTADVYKNALEIARVSRIIKAAGVRLDG
jgi:hypothetical protein